MLPLVGIEPQALRFQVQHATPYPNWALATWQIFKLRVHAPLDFLDFGDSVRINRA